MIRPLSMFAVTCQWLYIGTNNFFIPIFCRVYRFPLLINLQHRKKTGNSIGGGATGKMWGHRCLGLSCNTKSSLLTKVALFAGKKADHVSKIRQIIQVGLVTLGKHCTVKILTVCGFPPQWFTLYNVKFTHFSLFPYSCSQSNFFISRKYTSSQWCYNMLVQPVQKIYGEHWLLSWTLIIVLMLN